MKQTDDATTGIIFNIQKFSIHDGPGIRTVVFFKGCPLRCRWCSNPESQLPQIQVLWDQKKCIDCRHCVMLCPANAISLLHEHIHINASACTSCGRCVLECPGKALKLEGKRKTVQEIMDVVLQDQAFYEESGGGITLSGGEVLAQPAFSIELLLAAKENGLHTCCETTGFSRPDIFDHVTEYADFILFDMKHWSPQKHLEGTGVTNELSLSNMKRAIGSGKEVLPRIPVIPGFNHSLEDAAKLADALHTAGARKCQILPFHQFGENKYHLLNKPYFYQGVPSLHKEDLPDYLQVFTSHGIDAFF